jgi:hypothetical protein
MAQLCFYLYALSKLKHAMAPEPLERDLDREDRVSAVGIASQANCITGEKEEGTRGGRTETKRASVKQSNSCRGKVWAIAHFFPCLSRAVPLRSSLESWRKAM